MNEDREKMTMNSERAREEERFAQLITIDAAATDRRCEFHVKSMAMAGAFSFGFTGAESRWLVALVNVLPPPPPPQQPLKPLLRASTLVGNVRHN